MSCHGLGSWLHSEQIGCGRSLRKCFLGEQAKEGVHPQGRSWFGDASTSAAVHCCGVGVCNKVDTAPVSIRLARVCPDSNLGSKDKVAAIHTHTHLPNGKHARASAPARHCANACPILRTRTQVHPLSTAHTPAKWSARSCVHSLSTVCTPSNW